MRRPLKLYLGLVCRSVTETASQRDEWEFYLFQSVQGFLLFHHHRLHPCESRSFAHHSLAAWRCGRGCFLWRLLRLWRVHYFLGQRTIFGLRRFPRLTPFSSLPKPPVGLRELSCVCGQLSPGESLDHGPSGRHRFVTRF